MRLSEPGPARQPSQWTEPLQAAVAAFFLAGAVVNLALVLAFGDLYRRYYTEVYLQDRLPLDQLSASVEGSVSVVTAVTVALAITYLALAALTLARRDRWLFIADMVALFLAGVPSLVGGLLNLVSPSPAALPQVFALTRGVLALVAAALFLLMLGLSLRYGVWAQRRSAMAATG